MKGGSTMHETDRSSVRRGRRRWHYAGLLVTTVALFLAAGVGTASAATLTSDDFEDGNAAGWTTTGGTWIVKQEDSRVLGQSSLAANALARTGQIDWRNYTVAADVKANSFNGMPGFIGVVARAQSTSTYYALVIRPNSTAALTRTINGTTSTLDTASITVNEKSWYKLSLKVDDRKLTGSVNGVELSATDGFAFTGPAGLVTTWATASFDNVAVDN